MASTYSDNNGLEKPGDGEQSGTWGQTVNTNTDLLDEALEGQVIVTLPAIGTTGAPNSFAIADGSTAPARHRYVTFADSGDLGGTAYAQLTPNNAEKLYFVRNSLSASRSLVLFQGTYNAGRAVTVSAGEVLLIGFDGAGATGAGTRIAQLPLNTGTIVSQDSNSISITGGTITGVTFGSASVSITGGTISGTNITGLTSDLPIADGGTGASTAANARANLGVSIGSDVQGWDTNLDQLAGLTPTDSNFVVGNGSAWIAEGAATARTSLGLGTIATQSTASVAITGGTITGITDLTVADGGTGASTASAARTNLGAYGSGDNVSFGTNASFSENLLHTGDTDTRMRFGINTVFLQTTAQELRLNDSGMRLGGANAVVTTILDQDTMSSNSATALATQQSIKAYSDSRDWTFSTTVVPAGGETNFEFTGVPDEVNELVMVGSVTLTGTNSLVTQLRTTSGNESTGYTGGGNVYHANQTTGSLQNAGLYVLNNYALSGGTFRFTVRWVRYSGLSWQGTASHQKTDLLGGSSNAYKTMPSRVGGMRLLRNASDTFVAGGHIAMGWRF